MSYLCPHQCEGKTEYGYCRYTWCVNPLHNNLGTAQQGQGVQRAVITHADRIRAMSDEELADWVWGAETAGRAFGPRGKKAWLGWLKQEAE